MAIVAAVFFFFIGVGAAALYYNSEINRIKADKQRSLDAVAREEECKRNKSEAELDRCRELIIANTVRAIMQGSTDYEDFSIPYMADLVIEHSPTMEYNLYNIEHCTYDNILDALNYCFRKEKSIYLIHDEFAKIGTEVSYYDITCHFDEDIPLKELTSEYANMVIEKYFEETQNTEL